MKNVLSVMLMFIICASQAQQKVGVKSVSAKANTDLVKLNDSIPVLIPKKINSKYGFVNQKGKVIIKPEYSNVGFSVSIRPESVSISLKKVTSDNVRLNLKHSFFMPML